MKEIKHKSGGIIKHQRVGDLDQVMPQMQQSKTVRRLANKHRGYNRSTSALTGAPEPTDPTDQLKTLGGKRETDGRLQCDSI